MQAALPFLMPGALPRMLRPPGASSRPVFPTLRTGVIRQTSAHRLGSPGAFSNLNVGSVILIWVPIAGHPFFTPCVTAHCFLPAYTTLLETRRIVKAKAVFAPGHSAGSHLCHVRAEAVTKLRLPFEPRFLPVKPKLLHRFQRMFISTSPTSKALKI